MDPQPLASSAVLPLLRYHLDQQNTPALPDATISSRTPLAVDLHVHSRYAPAVSPAMTLENMISCAQRKGIDVLGTGDCLQPNWLAEIETKLRPTGSGLLAVPPQLQVKCQAAIPCRSHRPLHFVLSTEVCCAPRGTPRLGGLHHLLYFRSIDSVRKLQSRLGRFGDLMSGRPTLALSSTALFEIVLEQDDGIELAPAHVLNPWFSALGSVSGGTCLSDTFGAFTPYLLGVEMGPTSTPAMCRRLSTLDEHALFCCSDAHSVENIGQEYTRIDAALSYVGIMRALRNRSDPASRWVKFPIERTRYYRNWCGQCEYTCDGQTCPRCGRRLATGTRDRVSAIADRSVASKTAAGKDLPLLPLAPLIAEFMGVAEPNPRVQRVHDRLLSLVGHERHILTEASEVQIATATTSDLARAIVRQRTSRSNVFCGWQLSLNLSSS